MEDIATTYIETVRRLVGHDLDVGQGLDFDLQPIVARAREIDHEDDRADALASEVRALSQSGRLDAAVRLSTYAQDLCPEAHYENALMYAELGERLLAAGSLQWQVRPGVAKLLLELARSEAQQVKEGSPLWHKPAALAAVARVMDLAGRAEEAKELRASAVQLAKEGEGGADIQDSIDSSSVLWEISEDMAAVSDWKEAEHTAGSIRNSGKRDSALRNLEELRRGNMGAFGKLRQSRAM